MQGGIKQTPVLEDGSPNGFAFTNEAKGGKHVTLVDDAGIPIVLNGGSTNPLVNITYNDEGTITLHFADTTTSTVDISNFLTIVLSGLLLFTEEVSQILFIDITYQYKTYLESAFRNSGTSVRFVIDDYYNGVQDGKFWATLYDDNGDDITAGDIIGGLVVDQDGIYFRDINNIPDRVLTQTQAITTSPVIINADTEAIEHGMQFEKINSTYEYSTLIHEDFSNTTTSERTSLDTQYTGIQDGKLWLTQRDINEDIIGGLVTDKNGVYFRDILNVEKKLAFENDTLLSSILIRNTVPYVVPTVQTDISFDTVVFNEDATRFSFDLPTNELEVLKSGKYEFILNANVNKTGVGDAGAINLGLILNGISGKGQYRKFKPSEEGTNDTTTANIVAVISLTAGDFVRFSNQETGSGVLSMVDDSFNYPIDLSINYLGKVI